MKVGDYMMHRMHGKGDGTLVRLDKETSPGRWAIQYVQILHDGHDVIGGGSSSSWEGSDFSPVTDAKLLAASKCYEARRQIHDLKYNLNAQEREAETWRRVVQVMHEASAVSVDTTPREG